MQLKKGKDPSFQLNVEGNTTKLSYSQLIYCYWISAFLLLFCSVSLIEERN